MQHMYFCMHVFGRHHLPAWTLLWMQNKFVSFHPSNWDQLSVYSCGNIYTPVISCPCCPLAAPPQRKASWTYRSTGLPSRPWQHSVALHPATAAASWCRSPTAAPASSPSPAWSHCHSQSSSLMSPPANGPHRTELHSGHDACGHDGEEKMMRVSDVHQRMISWLKAVMSNYESYQFHTDWWQIKASFTSSTDIFFSFPHKVTVILASLKPFWLTTKSAGRTIFLNQHFYFEADERWRGKKKWQADSRK